MASDRLTMSELASGFHIRSADPDRFESPAALESENQWEVLGAILVRAQRGDFSELPRIAGLLRSTANSLIWYAGVELFSLASPWDRILAFARDFNDRSDDSTTQEYLVSLFANACDLRAVDELLRIHQRSESDDVRYEVERNLSHLLEPANGPLWWGAEENEIARESADGDVVRVVEVDKVGYAAAVSRTCAELRASLGTTAVFGAQRFEVARVAEQLRRRLLEKQLQMDRIDHERMIVEAATGVDTSAFIDPAGGIASLRALAVLEDFLESDLSRFEPGRRYFFGHAIHDEGLPFPV